MINGVVISIDIQSRLGHSEYKCNYDMINRVVISIDIQNRLGHSEYKCNYDVSIEWLLV